MRVHVRVHVRVYVRVHMRVFLAFIVCVFVWFVCNCYRTLTFSDISVCDDLSE